MLNVVKEYMELKGETLRHFVQEVLQCCVSFEIAVIFLRAEICSQSRLLKCYKSYPA